MENTNKLIIIIFGVLMLLIIAQGAISYNQQKSINKLEARLTKENSQLPSAGGSEKNASLAKLNEMIDSEGDKIYFIYGKVLGISGNNISVEAQILDKDMAKKIVADPELSKEYQSKKAPTKKKTFSVAVTGETKFLSHKLEEIKAGDGITVQSKEAISQTDKLTAVSVFSPYTEPEIPGLSK